MKNQNARPRLGYLVKLFWDFCRIRGIIFTTSTVCQYLFNKVFKSARTFTFQGKSFPYLVHFYNKAYDNERAVEVPIIWDFVIKSKGKRILEVGNVLPNYFITNHEVLDKYEIFEGVINQDIIDFQPKNKYDLIISISTLEHVGWDEKPKQPLKILPAFKKLKNCLAKNGKIVVSLPIGQNLILDKLISQKKIIFDKTFYLKRITADNQWREVDFQEVKNIAYGKPFPGANGIIIGIIER